jgi:AraC-like DNA-binding protein
LALKHVIQKSPIPETKAFLTTKLFSAHFDPTLHFHSEYQLFLVLNGRGTRFIGDNIKPFKEGDIVFTGPDLPHLWRNESIYPNKKNKPVASGIVIYFRKDFLGESIHQKEELETIHHLFQRSLRGLEVIGKTNKMIRKMMFELLEMKGIQGIIQLLKILDTLAKSPDCHPIAHTGFKPVSKTTETDRMNRVYEYVMQNFRQKVSLEEAAAIANMTPTSFSRYFRSRVNKSFSDFLKEIRIDYACKLLNEEKININRIGYEAGFPTLSNFNKQFKRMTGKTPLHYKNDYLKVKIDTYGDF